MVDIVHLDFQKAFDLVSHDVFMAKLEDYGLNCCSFSPSLSPPVKPKVKVSPTKSGTQAHPDTLICSVMRFYPGGIEVKWLKNGQEQTARVVSTELMQNGDWTFQILAMLEMTPRSGDVYTCQVEHSSLPGPVTVLWEVQSDSARSKMLTGVGGFVLGLIFLALGLLVYLRNKKGEWDMSRMLEPWHHWDKMLSLPVCLQAPLPIRPQYKLSWSLAGASQCF
ncbi:DLA class II histocompatibility antigen, DR-1 beta chain [Alligator sinensis]|uniref:DLA class II histocompatibility antigen, DR-1 beta chain n=1 Tax=Alligator sinensis TaxID=38654 RepID=A0A1U7SU35_ALLSI|nr:DLA class II histocompatibility antigen, DR-1 beta chain [Alligator sinensis]